MNQTRTPSRNPAVFKALTTLSWILLAVAVALTVFLLIYRDKTGALSRVFASPKDRLSQEYSLREEEFAARGEKIRTEYETIAQRFHPVERLSRLLDRVVAFLTGSHGENAAYAAEDGSETVREDRAAPIAPHRTREALQTAPAEEEEE